MSNWPGDCSQLVQQQQQQQAMATNYQQNYNPSISHSGMAMTMNPMTATIKREPMPFSNSCSGSTAPSSYGGGVPQLQPRTSVATLGQQQQQQAPQQQPQPPQPTASNEAMYYNYNNAQVNNVARMYQNAVRPQAVNNLHYPNQSPNNPNIRIYQSPSSSAGGQAVHYQRTSPNNSNVSLQFQNNSPQQPQQQQQRPNNNITIRYANQAVNISGIRYQTPVSQTNPNVHYVNQQPTNSATALQIVNQLRQQQNNKQFIQELRNPSLSALLLGKANQIPSQNTNFGQPNQNYNSQQPNAGNINIHALAQKPKQPPPPQYVTNNAQRAYPPVSQPGLQYSNKRPMLTPSEKEGQYMSQQQMMPTLNQLLQPNPFATLNTNKAAVNRQQQSQFAPHSANAYRIHPNITQAPNVTVQMYNQGQNTYTMNNNNPPPPPPPPAPKVPTAAMPPPAMNTLGNYPETPSSFSMWHKPSQWNTTSESYPETQQQAKAQPTHPQRDTEQNLGVLPSPQTVTDKALVPTTVMSNTFPTTFLNGSGTGTANVSLPQSLPPPLPRPNVPPSSSSFMSNMPIQPLSSSSSSSSHTSSITTTSSSSTAAPMQTDKESSLSDKMNIDEDLQLPAIDDLSNIVRQIIDDCWADNDFDHRTFDSPELILGINSDSKTCSQPYDTDKDGRATNKCIQLSSSSLSLSQNKQPSRIKDIPNDMQVMKDLETGPTRNVPGHNLRKASGHQEMEKEPEEEGMSDISESDLRSLLTKKDKLPVVHVGTCGRELVIDMVLIDSQDFIKQLGEAKG